MSEPCIQEKRITVHGMEIDVLRDGLKTNITDLRKEIDDHVKGGWGWRVAVAGTAIALTAQIASAVFFYGKLCSLVEMHDRAIFRLEGKVLK